MLSFELTPQRGQGHKILCLGAHADDIEIGCGGTIRKLMERYKRCEIFWVVFSAEGPRRREAMKSARRILEGAAKKKVVVKNFRGSFFPFEGRRIKESFEQLKKQFQPDVIFTHCRGDLHQDHRTVCEFTWNTFRSHLIFEYEIPKYDGDLGAPNLFSPLDRAACERKVEHLLKAFPSQRVRPWFEKETFFSLMRLRGVECNSPSGYAEAFYCRKSVL